MNSFGRKFIVTTFGESHGEAIGCVIDGVPANLKIDEKFIQSELDRRKPGKNRFSTQRKEKDIFKILSGVFEGFSTGTPIAIIITNENQKSRDYDNIKDIFRPSHSDFTYFNKYGIRDYRGGGRSSARETAMRVAGGAIAKLILKEIGVKIISGISEIDGIKSKIYDFRYAKNSEIYSLDKNVEDQQKEAILKAKNSHNSVGGAVFVKAIGVPVGLGEPIYYKLDSIIASAMMSINAVKSVEIGAGQLSSSLKGDQNNDEIRSSGFMTNNSGGILGGISNGDDINIKVYFKPTPSIFKPQKTVTKENKDTICELKGRHDPCVAVRGSIVCEAMLSIILVDMLLLNSSSQIKYIKNIYC